MQLSLYSLSHILSRDIIQRVGVSGGLLVEQVTGAATGADGEIIPLEGEGLQPGTDAGRTGFTHKDQIGAEEIDIGDSLWANFALYWEVFRMDDTLICGHVVEAGDGRKYSSQQDTGTIAGYHV